MAKFKCKNRFSCEFADSGEIFELPVGETKCPNCGADAIADEGPCGGPGPGHAIDTRIVLAGVAAVVLAVAGAGIWYLKKTPPQPNQETIVATTPVPQVVPSPTSTPYLAIPEDKLPKTEKEAKGLCDSATKAGQGDAKQICDRATAITLMNSGALSAKDGKLAEAEKDYQAALAKDPSFDVTYYNLAALHVRQNRFEDAIKQLDEAYKRGYTAIGFVDKDATFEPLRQDKTWGPIFKEKYEAAVNNHKVAEPAAAAPTPAPAKKP